jgi:hypothetical protein
MSSRYEKVGASTAKSVEGRRLVVGGHQTPGDGETEEKDRSRKYKKITLLHFNSRLGEVRLEPVFGHVNGAQFSIGF